MRHQKKSRKRHQKTVEDVLEGAKPGRETNGRAKQYEKPGGFAEALKDFESLKPTNIQDKGSDDKEKKIGQLPNGRMINVREESSFKKPTLEIQEVNSKKSIKIRYTG